MERPGVIITVSHLGCCHSGNRERTPLTLLALGLVISGIVAWLIDFVGSGLESIIQGNMHDRIDQMSPSVFREKGYRFYFLSNEEERMHIHVTSEDGDANSG